MLSTGNLWDNGVVGNYWDDFEFNPGYPDYYEIYGDGDGIDHYPQMVTTTTTTTTSTTSTTTIPSIKMGIIGPVGSSFYSPAGMKEAAEMASNEINSTGGVQVGTRFYPIELVFGDEYCYPIPDPVGAATEVERLITVEGVNFIIGGYCTPTTAAMIETAMDYEVPFFIVGASQNELISETVGTDYSRYKYLFRTTFNTTTLFNKMTGFQEYDVIPILLPIYGQDLDSNPVTPDQVRVAVLTEDSPWTETIHQYLTDPIIYPLILGPHTYVTYSARVPEGTTDFTPYLNDVNASEARLLIHAFSGITAVDLIVQWRIMEIQAIPVGINYFGQLQTHWTTTIGMCEYETIMDVTGTRTPLVPRKTEVFWDNFSNISTWPVYTAFMTYDTIYALKEAIESIGTLNNDALVTLFEDPSYDRLALNGVFKFTKDHDAYSDGYDPLWLYDYTKPLVVQWQAGRKEVVWPTDEVYSKVVALPPWLYPYVTDINYDCKVDIYDIVIAAGAYNTKPGDRKWDKRADLNNNWKIDIYDIVMMAGDYGDKWDCPL